MDKVESGIELLYRPASLFSQAGRYDNPMLESGTMNLATVEPQSTECQPPFSDVHSIMMEKLAQA